MDRKTEALMGTIRGWNLKPEAGATNQMKELRIVENLLFEQVRNWSGVMKAEQIVQ
jgi:hypothetical protein